MYSSTDLCLNLAIQRAAAKGSDSHTFTRKSPLSCEEILRLFLGAEGGSLDKILYAAGIEVTASAVTQRRAQIKPEVFRAVFDNFNATCKDSEFFRDYRLFAVDGTTINNQSSAQSVCSVVCP